MSASAQKVASSSSSQRPSTSGGRMNVFFTGGTRSFFSPSASTPSIPRFNSGSEAKSDAGSWRREADPFVARRPHPSRTTTTSTSIQVNPTSQMQKTARRSSNIFSVAHNALTSRFSRRGSVSSRPPAPAPAESILFPDVIDISRRESEQLAERERLREEAAQSIGVADPLENSSVLDSTHSLLEVNQEDEQSGAQYATDMHPQDSHPPPNSRSPQGSTFSSTSAYRSGAHTRTRTQSGPRAKSQPEDHQPIPAFPSTPSALTPHARLSAALPKYHNGPSVFAFGKQWKQRHVVLTFPSSPGTTQQPNPAYVHLFKSGNSWEREIERLAIDEASVAFVAEDEVGGRRGVISLGGLNEGAEISTPSFREMWMFHLPDQAEAQRWINTIKGSILSQRSVRAGLGSTTSSSTNEPHGDMDVMLTMRAHDFMTARPLNSGRRTEVPSVNEKSGAPKLKSLFSPSTRPRSLSKSHPSTSPGAHEDRPNSPVLSMKSSLGADEIAHHRAGAAASLMGVLKADSAARHSPKPPSIISAYSDNATANGNSNGVVSPALGSPITARPLESVPELEKRIVEEPDVGHRQAASSRHYRSQSGTQLHPAPRRRVMSSTTVDPPVTSTSQSPPSDAGRPRADTLSPYMHAPAAASNAGSFGKPSIEPPASPTTSTYSSNTPNDGTSSRIRVPSIQSVATYETTESATASLGDFAPASKRWSRQGKIPKRLSPPKGPPPSIPDDEREINGPPSPRSSPGASPPSLHPHAGYRNAVIPTTSAHGSRTKRASESSTLSYISAVSSQSFMPFNGNGSVFPSAHGTLKGHRTSLPPPARPAPSFAPPPVPSESKRTSSPGSPPAAVKSSLRDRAARMSLVAPKPAPVSALPPRPDEFGLGLSLTAADRNRKRRSGATSLLGSTLPSIPASPDVAGQVMAAHIGNGHVKHDSTPSQPSSRRSSLRQRLRLRSAPSPTVSNAVPKQVLTTQSNGATHDDEYLESFIPSAPGTPLVDSNLDLWSQPNFLHAHDELPLDEYPSKLVSMPVKRRDYARESFLPGDSPPLVTSLSPPPRRLSTHIATLEPARASTPRVNDDGDTTITMDGILQASIRRRGSLGAIAI